VGRITEAGRDIFLFLKNKYLSLQCADLLECVRMYYKLGENFPDVYMTKQLGEDYKAKYKNLEELFGKLEKLDRIYFDFALSSNLRGDNVAKTLKPYFKSNYKKYIDVGCAYGGFVVGFAKEGFDAYGLEFDEQFARYGILNCEDHGLYDRITIGDIQNVDLKSIGKFDVITCNDVIEHVSDVDLTISTLSSMLNNHGLLNMVIPNKNSISFVQSDGHFQLFGITLLERNLAKQYKYEMTGIEDSYEHMGEYYPIDYYRNVLTINNMKIERISNLEVKSIVLFAEYMDGLKEEYDKWFNNDRKKVSSMLSTSICERYNEYVDRIKVGYDAAITSREVDRFIANYFANFWDVVATKNSPG